MSSPTSSRAGLRAPEKPIGSYLFTGPTGVGKTEVARQLAKTMGIELLRFDMSEYMERHTVSRLIGAPPHVGTLSERNAVPDDREPLDLQPQRIADDRVTGFMVGERLPPRMMA